VRPLCLCLLLYGALTSLWTADKLSANGGTLQLSRAPAGPFDLTVFTSPTPLRVGPADVSVAVERADSGDVEPNARVIVLAEPVGREGARTAYEASHERATDPSFYAADVSLTSVGRWRFEVLVQNAAAEGSASFEADVPPPSTPLSPRLTLVGVVGLLAMAVVLGLRWCHRRGLRSVL